MTTRNLKNKNVAILVTDGFEEVELTSPRTASEDAGADVKIVSPQRESVRAWRHTEWSTQYKVNIHLSDADPKNFDALLLPGGVMNPDQLRMNNRALDFVRHFFQQGKPVGAICHGPWLLIDAGVVRDRKVTSYQSIRSDLQNAGADWGNTAVMVDNGLVTSRTPDDLEAFNAKLLEEIAEGPHDPTVGSWRTPQHAT